MKKTLLINLIILFSLIVLIEATFRFIFSYNVQGISKNLINKETVEYFPKGAVITNVARGDIVDDDALIDALNRRKIYAVGLDVYKNEPNLNPGYLKIESAFILPHLGSATKDTRIAMANLAIDNIDEFFRTANCKNKVN